MKKSESLEEFYKRKFDWIPKSLSQEIGHFNLFRLEPIRKEQRVSLPYRRRDYYKIMLCVGGVAFQYADKVVSINQQAMVFSNPQIPYNCEHLDKIKGGFYCIFNRQFFHQFGNIDKYTVFHPTNDHIFELTDEPAYSVSQIYKKMFEEFNSDYAYKYDLLKALTFELIHFGMKLSPSPQFQPKNNNASQRITSLFLELLERQFPIDENHTKLRFRSPSEFAKQLNVHVNHLNKALKETTQKTTTQAIAERILYEAKLLLKQSNWNISEIAYALGFSEATHFNNFFKKHTQLNPSKFRKRSIK